MSRRNRGPVIRVGAFLFLGLVLIGLTKAQTHSWEKQLRILTPPPPTLEHMTFGHDETIADILWIRTIQDLEYCDAKRCQRGWTYQMLDMITDLDPTFRQPFALGTVSLSLISEDFEGATLLFNKAMALHPEDWTYYYRAAYHAMENEKKLEKAANLFRQAAENGGPTWVYSLATKNYLRADRKKLAETMYQTLKKENIPPNILSRIRERIDTNNSGHMDGKLPEMDPREE